MRHEPELTDKEIEERWRWLNSPATEEDLAEIEARWTRTLEWNESFGPPMKESPSADISRLLATIRGLKAHFGETT